MDERILEQMVDSRDKQKEDLNSESKYEEDKAYVEGIYIFVSFDLVNSTLFKSRHMELWPGFISTFYETVAEEFAVGRYRDSFEKLEGSSLNGYKTAVLQTGGFQLWKLVGDEVLLYHKLVSKEEFYQTILFIDLKRKKIIEKTIANYLNKEFPEGDFENTSKKEIQERQKECGYLFKQYFAVKTTAWCGSCASNESGISLRSLNVIYDQMRLNNEEVSPSNRLDFLGPDIDEGFRLCEYAEKNQFILTPKLVYLLYRLFRTDKDKRSLLDMNFKIVNYISMKGVWEHRLYPILMFCQHDPDGSPPFELWKQQFEYDAFESSRLYVNIEKYGEDFVTNSQFSVKYLEKIYNDIARENEMQDLEAVFIDQEKSITGVSGERAKLLDKRPPKFEFHISCLCYDMKKRKYWFTKHTTHGWSFGCVGITQNEHYYESVKAAYKEKYNLDIALDEKNPIISFYSTDRKPASLGSILGVVILVTDVKGRGVKEGIESKWYKYTDLKKLENDKKLTDFDAIIKRAESILAEMDDSLSKDDDSQH